MFYFTKMSLDKYRDFMETQGYRKGNYKTENCRDKVKRK